VSGAFSQRSGHHKKLISRLAVWAVLVSAIAISRRYSSSCWETAIILILGFALGYGVREWAFRQSDCAGQRRRRPL